MAQRYRIPSGVHRAEQVIERSRFVATIAHAATTADARETIDSVRREWPDATHHCSAWIAGPPGSSTQVGMSDDGEPHGTAGRPMLNVLTHSPVGEIVSIVTRWYGGTKLGTGGLARAYAGTVELALSDLPTVERIDWVELLLIAGYEHVSAIQRCLPEHEAESLSEEFAADARFRIRLPRERRERLERAIADLTSGRARIQD